MHFIFSVCLAFFHQVVLISPLPWVIYALLCVMFAASCILHCMSKKTAPAGEPCPVCVSTCPPLVCMPCGWMPCCLSSSPAKQIFLTVHPLQRTYACVCVCYECVCSFCTLRTNIFILMVKWGHIFKVGVRVKTWFEG